MTPERKKKLVFVAKVVFSVTALGVIFYRVTGREGAGDLLARLSAISPAWLAAAVLMQLTAISCSITRWRQLLIGQGIHAPWRHLIGSFWICRFFGAFAPGGWTGEKGFRIYDIASQTGKAARAGATIGI